MTLLTTIEAIRITIADEMERDDRVFLLGEDVGRKGGVFKASEGLLERFGPRRVIDMPISESAIVGVAIGAALQGLRPIAEIQFADYLHPAFDQIVSEAARYRYRSRGAWSCPLVIRAPWGAGIHGGLYHSQSVEAFYCHVPGIKVVAPSTAADAAGLLRAAIRDPDPVLFLEHKRVYRGIRDDVPEGDFTVPIGKAVVRRAGCDLTIVAWGMVAHYALEAASLLAQEDIQAEVIDPRTLAPLDLGTMIASVRKTGRLLVVHEDNLTGGLGAEISAAVTEHTFPFLDAPVRRLAAPDVPAMPFEQGMEQFCMPDAPKIVEAARQLVVY